MLGVLGRSSAVMNVMVMAVEKAARGLVRDFGELEKLQASRKGFGNFVTTADRRSEEILIDALAHARPEYDILTEESGSIRAEQHRSRFDQNGGYCWIIDPLDGTTNFWHGVPHFAISVAIEHNGNILAGVVFNPLTSELYWAEQGQGAFLNKQRIRVSGRREMETALLATGSAFGMRGVPGAAQCLQEIASKVGSSRHLGATSLDLAFVASGRLDAFFEADLPLWDRAAGQVLVQEAGGVVGGIHPDYPSSILATNSALAAPMQRLISQTVPR